MRSGTSTPVLVAAVLMVGFMVWLLLQMAPHGPREGEILMRLAAGLGVALVGTTLILAVMWLLRSRHR